MLHIMNENLPTKEAVTLETIESIRYRMREEVSRAKMHALDEDADSVAIQEYLDLCTQDLLPESSKSSTYSKENLRAREQTVHAATARANNLVEFRLLLEEANLRSALVQEFVAHENAHANVAEQHFDTTHFMGYGLIFFKRGGRISATQPCILEEKKAGADTLAYIGSMIRVLEAPDMYGEVCSKDDEQELRKYEEIAKLYN